MPKFITIVLQGYSVVFTFQTFNQINNSNNVHATEFAIFLYTMNSKDTT